MARLGSSQWELHWQAIECDSEGRIASKKLKGKEDNDVQILMCCTHQRESECSDGDGSSDEQALRHDLLGLVRSHHLVVLVRPILLL